MDQEIKDKKMEEWMNMSTKERCKWNGFDGFLNNELVQTHSLFLAQDKQKVEERRVKDKIKNDRYRERANGY